MNLLLDLLLSKDALNVFAVLKMAIENDYGGMLEGDRPNIAAIISWAAKKSFIIQAITIIEAKMTYEFVRSDAYPTIYRIDRIKQYKVLDERFRIPYANKFEEGEFRKRIQFMYGGKLQKVRFTWEIL